MIKEKRSKQQESLKQKLAALDEIEKVGKEDIEK